MSRPIAHFKLPILTLFETEACYYCITYSPVGRSSPAGKLWAPTVGRSIFKQNNTKYFDRRMPFIHKMLHFTLTHFFARHPHDQSSSFSHPLSIEANNGDVTVIAATSYLSRKLPGVMTHTRNQLEQSRWGQLTWFFHLVLIMRL